MLLDFFLGLFLVPAWFVVCAAVFFLAEGWVALFIDCLLRVLTMSESVKRWLVGWLLSLISVWVGRWMDSFILHAFFRWLDACWGWL
ncbi:hypothetical protein CCL15_24205 [Pseudomonas syringae]|nr:hypothetical protein CCL15_24205 [Pseudomonas syringae]